MIKEVDNTSFILKIVSYLALASVVTIVLFYFMAFLISGGKSFKKSSDTENLIEFVRIKRPTDTEIKKRKLPKKPEIIEQPKTTKSLTLNEQRSEPQRPNMKFDTPQLDIPLAIGAGGVGIASGNGGQGGNQSDEMPLVRVEPQFPREAIMKGIDRGWVRVSFDLNPDGTVTNVRIVDSSPREIFDTSARRAILRWKYRPKIVDGKGVIRKGIKVQLDYGMENER